MTNYRPDANGNLVVQGSDILGMNFMGEPTMPSGRAGLVSTAEGYYRFAQMLANTGKLGDTRILAPATVNSWRQITARQSSHWRIRRRHARMQPGFGYGFNCGNLRSPVANLPDGKGDIPMGWRGRHVVLGGPGERYRLRHDE